MSDRAAVSQGKEAADCPEQGNDNAGIHLRHPRTQQHLDKEIRINMASAKSVKSKSIKEQTEDFNNDTIEDQVAAFLASGGKIQQIPLGVSGQVATSGPRHITLGKRHAN
jgi:hypothetical protein